MEIPNSNNESPFCSICDQNIPTFCIANCQHCFCEPCLKELLSVRIKLGEVPVMCPARKCQNPLPLSDAKQLLESSLWDRLKYLTDLHNSPNSRPCPRCNKINTFQDPISPDLSCWLHCSCGTVYCLAHSNAHSPSISCPEFEKSLKARPEEQLSQEFLQKFKKCPNCKVIIEVVEGTCDHIKCRCGTKFCYRCQSTEFEGKYMPTCKKCGTGYIDHDFFWCYFIVLILLFPLWIPLALLWSCLFLMCLPCWCLNHDETASDSEYFKGACCCFLLFCTTGHCVDWNNDIKITRCCCCHCEGV